MGVGDQRAGLSPVACCPAGAEVVVRRLSSTKVLRGFFRI
jgi:hypothetical protein